MVSIDPVPDYSAVFGVEALGALERMYEQVDRSIERQAAEDQSIFRDLVSGGEGLPSTGPKLHQALRDYIGWVRKEYYDAEQDSITDWGQTKIKQAETLIDRHPDLPLAQVNYSKIEEFYRFWRERPVRKGSHQRIAKKTAEHQIAALKDFFKWLHKCPDYDWRKPDDFAEIKTGVRTIEADRRAQISPDALFSLEELTLLNRYATPLERYLLLLGLNCAFTQAEIADLRVGEIFLHRPHSPHHQEILAYAMEDSDSFVKRCRGKTGVYGEHILFPQTVQAMEWALARRRRQPGFGPEARLLLNKAGKPYDQPSNAGNPNRQITNRFAALLRRIEKDGKPIRRLPFKMLRKTSGDLIRRYADGEIAGVFLGHGQPVRTDNLADVYTSRPFGKVFRALRKVEQYLQPMFEAAGADPFGR